MAKVDEARYYRNVAIWLEKKGYYIGRGEPNVYREKELFIKKGRKKAQVDVAGVKNVGKTYFDDIEIVIIEVKHSKYQRPIALKELEQTRGYQAYAHKCFLAVTETINITKENEEDANKFGIGLLRIPLDFYRKKPSEITVEDIEVIRTPRKTSPSEPEMLEFLHRLYILKCALCGCYFHWWIEYEEEFPRLPPKGLSSKRLVRNKVFELFPDKIENQFNTQHKYRKSKMRRHLCLSCVEDLAKLYGIDKLKKEVARIKEEILKLKQ